MKFSFRALGVPSLNNVSNQPEPVKPAAVAVVELATVEASTEPSVEPVAERLGVAIERYGLSDRHVTVLRKLFYEEGYRSAAGLDPAVTPDDAFQHYLNHGIEKDVSPGPFFDSDFCRTAMTSTSVEPIEWLRTGLMHMLGMGTPAEKEPSTPTIVAWLKAGGENKIVPTPFFDSAYYLTQYADVARAGVNPFLHFLEHGRAERRIPSPGLAALVKLLGTYKGSIADPLSRVMWLLPGEAANIKTDTPIINFYTSFVQPDFYAAQLPPGTSIHAKGHAVHCLVEGLAQGARPSILFNPEYYRRILATHTVAEPKNLFLHWLFCGFPNRIVPTPLFDEQFYLRRYPDLEKSPLWGFQHFTLHGIGENRLPNALFYFDSRQKNFDPTDSCGRLTLGPHFAVDAIPDSADLKTTSRLEIASAIMLDKIGRLQSPEMQALIAHAAEIEPLVLRPGTGGIITWPPLTHHAARATRAGVALRRSLEKNHYDTIVLIPHCRTAGSARVAGFLVQNLRELYPDESLLLVLTDGSFYEHPEWFGTGHDFCDLAEHIRGAPANYQIQLLLDLLRGLQPRRVFNVNSLLGWNLTKRFGAQLSKEMQIFAYLFTWDIDVFGRKGGYPIEFFETGFDHLTRVLFDNRTLMDELIWRYSMPARLQDKLRVTYVPMEAPRFLYNENFAVRRSRGRSLRCFWAGRFDRQKRFDLAIEIARRRPDLEIAAWGKRVIGDSSLDLSNIPGNLKLMGAYEFFEEVPLQSFDFFLYTSQWDGLPNVVVECGMVGLPIVASRVGGVGELIDETTGWPVDDVLNPDAYIQAIDAMAAQPDVVSQRAAALARRARTMFSVQQYRESLLSAIESPA